MGQVLDPGDEFVAPFSHDNARDLITRVRLGREILKIAMVADEDHQGPCVIKLLQQASHKAVEPFKDFHGPGHIPAVAYIIGEPVFEQGKVMLPGKLPAMPPRFFRCNGLKRRITILGPLCARNIRGNCTVESQRVGAQQGDTGKLAREGRHGQTPVARFNIVEELLRKRVDKADRQSPFLQLPKNVLRFDHRAECRRGMGTEVSSDHPGGIHSGEDCGLPRATLWKTGYPQRRIHRDEAGLRCRTSLEPRRGQFPIQQGTETGNVRPEERIYIGERLADPHAVNK